MLGVKPPALFQGEKRTMSSSEYSLDIKYIIAFSGETTYPASPSES